ncbi:hypothetical protein G0Q06_11625 [Puniceicoccales bacterium CK1056]|uniref:Lipoprotein n=1 Tax=Oceanipulchritudo coccoides TaxID=2706888 RepID=A0A6B2M4U2_9BACT|nr:hypothetical protein [Oceanipulchritudo coccoides]NDV63104.1 hypothetical protein [Oceanipulchritudo coccoides]
MSPKLSKLQTLIIIPACLALLSGCGKSEPEFVVVKNVETPPAEVEDHSGHNHAMDEAHAHAEAAPQGLGFTFSIPEDWTQQPPSQMKLLSFKAGTPPELMAECAVSAFPGDVGGRLANINRWRRQVGLGPTTEEVADSFVQELKISGMDAWQVDFTGPGDPAGRVVVSVVFHNEQSWFFKLSGNEASVREELESYGTFIDSVQF